MTSFAEQHVTSRSGVTSSEANVMNDGFLGLFGTTAVVYAQAGLLRYGIC